MTWIPQPLCTSDFVARQNKRASPIFHLHHEGINLKRTNYNSSFVADLKNQIDWAWGSSSPTSRSSCVFMLRQVTALSHSGSSTAVGRAGRVFFCFLRHCEQIEWIQCNSVTWLSTSPDCRLKTCIEKDYMSYEHVQQNVMWGHEPVWAEPACVCCLKVYFWLPFVLNRSHICNSPVYSSSSSSYFIVTYQITFLHKNSTTTRLLTDEGRRIQSKCSSHANASIKAI